MRTARPGQSTSQGAWISDCWWREEVRDLEPAVAVRRAHHGDVNGLVTQPGDPSGPLSFDRWLPFELKAELAKELNRRRQVVDDNAHIVHPWKRRMPVNSPRGGRGRKRCL